MVRRKPPQVELFLIRRVPTKESNPTFRHEFANRQEPKVGMPIGLVFIVMLTILGLSRKELKLCPCEKRRSCRWKFAMMTETPVDPVEYPISSPATSPMPLRTRELSSFHVAVSLSATVVICSLLLLFSIPLLQSITALEFGTQSFLILATILATTDCIFTWICVGAALQVCKAG